MGALIGLLAGVGMLLVWRSRQPDPPKLERTNGWMARRQDMLRQAGIEGVGPAQLVAAQIICALFVFVVIAAVTSALSVALCFGVFSFFLPVVIVSRMQQRRLVALRELWPEAVDNLGSAVRAGMSLPEAIAALAVRGPQPLQPAFARFGTAYRASGRFASCLDSLKADLADPVGDRVCETLRVAREVGGSDLGSVLRTLSELLRADARTRSELETRQGWIVNAARLAVAAPWLVLLLLGTQSTTLQAYNTAAGTIVLVIGAVVCFAAYRIMLRIGRLPVEARVLR